MSNLVPEWGQIFPSDNKIEILKLIGGVSYPTDLKSFSKRNHIIIGRSPESDIYFDEISCSRSHAIILYGKGPFEQRLDCAAFWIRDLGTQNGTFINNHLKMEPNEFYLLKNGYLLQFGINDIRFVFDYEQDIVGVDDCYIAKEEQELKSKKYMRESQYTDWGQRYDDQVTEPINSVNPEPAPKIDNPIEVVKNYFKQEGFEFNPEFVKLTTGMLRVVEATLILPIEDVNDEESNETVLKGQGENKPEALRHVCEMAYKLLHSRDLLNRHFSESYLNRKKRRLIENDYYNSDEDTFYDRTGSIEEKRDRRIKQNESHKANMSNIITSSSNYKSYLNKSSDYVPSKIISSRLSELNRQLMQATIDQAYTKRSIEKLKVEDLEDESEQRMALAEKTQLSTCLKNLKNKSKQILKQRSDLMTLLKRSVEIENDPELLKSLTTMSVTTVSSKQSNIEKDHTIVEQIINSYTHPTTCKLNPPEQKPFTNGNAKDNTNKATIVLNNDNNNNDDELKTTVNTSIQQVDQRDMIESEVEQLIDDSPISWVPHSENEMKFQDNLKNKYGY